MSKLITLCLLAWCRSAVSEVCSNSSGFQCLCKQLIDENTHFPQLMADCSVMSIENIPDQLERDVNFLDLTGNDIQTLDPKLHKLYSPNLNVFVLRLNRISHIDGEFFLALPNLRDLDLSSNYITSLDQHIFQNQKSLHRLDLSNNKIKVLPDKLFQPAGHLRILSLSYNLVGDFLRQAGSLTADIGLTSELTHLFLDGLNITQLPNAFFVGFKKLNSLHLADNAFDVVPSLPYSIEKVDLSGNNLTFVSAKYLNYPFLKSLVLNRMPSLRNIHHYAFYNLYALEKLTIRNCPNLVEFSDLAFDVVSKDTSHKHLKFLSLEGNGLRTLNESYRSFFRQMDHVDLRHNSWRCDCSILWIQDFESILYRSREIKCNFNSDGANANLKKIVDLNDKDLPDCHPEIYGKKSHRVLIIVLVLAVLVLCGLIFYLLRYPVKRFDVERRLAPTSPYTPASMTEQ